MKFIDKLVNILRKNIEEVPSYGAFWLKKCNKRRCRDNYVHCPNCRKRISEWFTPGGQNLQCKLCGTQTNWLCHEEYRRADRLTRIENNNNYYISEDILKIGP